MINERHFQGEDSLQLFKGNPCHSQKKYWCRILSLDIEDPVKYCYEWRTRNMQMRCWAMELKEEMFNIGLSFMWTKQQQCNLKDITKTLKDRCNDIERHNILAKLPEKSS